MIDEAIVLVGGKGTRLQSVIQDIPKPMAPVAGKPFLCHILNKLQKCGITKVVLATGYLHDVIYQYFGKNYANLTIKYSRENEPLLTGGAILQASQYIEGKNFFVLNGDTFFNADLNKFSAFHQTHALPLSILLRQVDNVERYGKVEVEGEVVIAFLEKGQNAGPGLINGGIYAINKAWLKDLNLPRKFSFEKQVLEQYYTSRSFVGMRSDAFFIDIGIPEDYKRAQTLFKTDLRNDDFLFLDRDGVINKLIEGDYVRKWEQFEFLNGAIESLAWLRKHFKRIFVVSNQQGVNKGLFTNDDLNNITDEMGKILDAQDAHIDRVYYCTDLANTGSRFRKPEIGMAIQAKNEFPDVDLSHSLMIGDSETDMIFGYNAQMRCVFLTKDNPVPPTVKNYTDLIFPNLRTFVSDFEKSQRA